MSEQTPVFNWEAPYATIREYGVSVRYEQGGMLFDRNGRFLEPYKNYQPPKSAVPTPAEAQQAQVTGNANQSRRDEVLERAQQKLADYAPRPDPDGVVAENAAAQHAERLAG